MSTKKEPPQFEDPLPYCMIQLYGASLSKNVEVTPPPTLGFMSHMGVEYIVKWEFATTPHPTTTCMKLGVWLAFLDSYAPVICNHRGFLLFSMQIPGICPVLRGHFYGQSPANSSFHIPAVKCEIFLPSVWACNQKPCTAGMILQELKTWHLSPTIPGP